MPLAGVLYHLQKEETELDQAIFTIGNIVPGEMKSTYRPGKDGLILNDNFESSISVEDYAVAMLNEVEKLHHNKELFTIG